MLLAHRALLAARSPYLRDLIDQESPAAIQINTQKDTTFQPIQLLLPQLLYNTAKNVLYYIYSDNLSQSCLTDFAQLRALSRAAEDLRMVSGLRDFPAYIT